VNTELHISPQHAKYDRNSTIALYRETITKAGADECNCTYCQNFAAQRTSAYTREFLDLLERIGADPCKELEVFDLGRASEDSGHRLYGGWFPFCGAIIEGGDWRPEHKPKSFTYWITDSFPSGGLPKGVCAIEFLCELPWLIPEQPEARWP
jgi:hypothetical protein